MELITGYDGGKWKGATSVWTRLDWRKGMIQLRPIHRF
jgi:hypothetical protein